MTHRYIKNVVTLEYSADKCVGCGMCAEVCPHQVFVMENGKARVVARDLCMECGACALNCAAKAISVRAGVGCAWGIMTSELLGRKTVCCG